MQGEVLLALQDSLGEEVEGAQQVKELGWRVGLARQLGLAAEHVGVEKELHSQGFPVRSA